jgi:4-amino-4-deoxy-L-arabinose transferase-like glycosyltransferase
MGLMHNLTRGGPVFNPSHSVSRQREVHLDMSGVKNLKNKLTLEQNLIPITLLCLIIILGAALRFYDLGAESYWIDEMNVVQRAQEDLEMIPVEPDSRTNPVYVLLAHFWIQVFGTTEAATRSLSALIGIAALAVMYTVGRELFGRKVGLLSALLMAISELQIYYSQTFRFYSLFLLLTLLSFLFYIQAFKSRKLSHFVLYVLASSLLFYTHLCGVFVLVAQNLYFFLQWNRYRSVRILWLLSQMLLLLTIGPGLLVAVVEWVTNTFPGMSWVPDPPLWLPLLTVLKYVFPGRHYPSWITLVAGAALFVSGTVLFAICRRKQWLASVKGLVISVQDLSNKENELLLVGCWLLCPIGLPLILSKVFNPMYVHKYTISAAPAFYLLLALGVTTLGKVVPEPISLGLLVILIAPGLHEYYVTDVNEQWPETAAYLEENGRQDDVIVFAPAEGGVIQRNFYWYYRGNLPGCGIDVQLKDDEAIADALTRCISDKERFWLIMRGDDEYIGHLRAFFLNRDHEAMRLIREQEFKDISIHLLELASDD